MFRYILRYAIIPGFHENERTAELLKFCRDGRVDEVMLFVGAEEMFPGHLLPEEVTAFLKMARPLKAALDREGIALSLNPWTTIGHQSRGRHLREGQNFRPIVGESGVASPLVACPLCEEWQAYLCRTFSQLARELNPVCFWIEDDWRLENHGKPLGTSGCFCDEHLRIFSERVGREVCREQLLSALLQEGEPHPWREKWIDLSGETLLLPLQKISAAIRCASEETAIGLMTGSPDVHSFEGRDWSAMQKAIAANGVSIIRPHMIPYTQTTALSAPPSNVRQTLAALPSPFAAFPELESSPRCGPWSKSAGYIAWQMLNIAAIGNQGITINHYDMMGNGIALHPGLEKTLKECKPMLDAISLISRDDRMGDGVDILFSPRIARHLQVQREASVKDLFHESKLGSHLLFHLGIAHRFTTEVTDERRPMLIHGQTLRAFDDAALRRLICRPVIFDAVATEIMVERGFGAALGVRQTGRKMLEESAFSYEEILEREGYDLHRPRMSAQRCASWIAEWTKDEATECLTEIRRYDHAPLGPGAMEFHNPEGGTMITLAYPIQTTAQFFMGFFNRFRKEFFQRLLYRISGDSPQAMVVNDPLFLFGNQVDSGSVYSVLNPSDDVASPITLRLPREKFKSGVNWQTLNASGDWEPSNPTLQPGEYFDEYTFPITIPALKAAFLRVLNR